MQNGFRAGRAAACAVAAAAVLAVLAGCGAISGKDNIRTMSGTAGPADAGQTSAAADPSSSPGSTGSTGSTKPAGATSTTQPTKPASGGGGSDSAEGCAADGGTAIPAGAGRATTADLDGDGKPDTIWLADLGSKRTLGVRTATGARLSTTFEDAAPENASATAARLGDGSAVILLDFGREAKLYAVVHCKIVPTHNAQGQQYTFDEGFTGYGTGVGCPVIGSGRHLAGYLAKGNSAGTSFMVTRTTIKLSGGGVKATNEGTTVLGKKLPAGSPTVKVAQSVSCGAGSTAVEPQS